MNERMKYTLRPAKAGDARAIRRLIYQVGINPLGLNWQRFLVAVDEQDTVIGTGQVKPHGDGSRELASIAVRSEHRGQGIARAIICRLLTMHPLPLYLTCRASLEPFYRKYGFYAVERSEDLPAYFRIVRRLAAAFQRIIPGSERLSIMRIDTIDRKNHNSFVC